MSLGLGWLAFAAVAVTGVQGEKSAVETERKELLSKAMASLQTAAKSLNDPVRPAYHFAAPALWMNDPNGPIYYQGWYHAFYQFNPYGDQWGHMHWGHARSRDLVNWEHLPIGVMPTLSKGEEHVFSGSTYLNVDGKPTIFYTSIGKREPEQWAATPLDPDLFAWQKVAENPVVSQQTHRSTHIEEWRDPFLFTVNGKTYMLTGGRENGRGVIVAHRAVNAELTKWIYQGVLFRYHNDRNLECPNFAKIGDRWMLLVSVNGRVESFVGKLDPEKIEFTSERPGVLLDGSYASQLLHDKDGRLVYLGWLNTNYHQGWNGCFTLPNEISLDAEGHILSKPYRELEKLRGEKFTLGNIDLTTPLDLSGRVREGQYELIVEIDPGTASKVSLRLLASPDGKRAVTVDYDVKAHRLVTQGRIPVDVTAKNGPLRLHLFVDRSTLDLYADGGAIAQSGAYRVDPEDRGLWIAAEGGAARVKSLTIYPMKAARFDSKRIQRSGS